MSRAKSDKSYQQMAEELATIVNWFESEEIELDQAVAKYELALELLDQMETYLKETENKIKKINAKFSDD